MRKYAIAMATVLVGLVAVNLLAQYTPVTKEQALSLSSTLTVAGTSTLNGKVNLAGTSLNVTNGQAVTVAKGAYTLSGIGGANDSTNTITLAAPAAAGDVVILSVATASTNLVTIADGTTVAASGAILMDADDTCMLVANGTAKWCLVSESDN